MDSKGFSERQASLKEAEAECRGLLQDEKSLGFSEFQTVLIRTPQRSTKLCGNVNANTAEYGLGRRHIQALLAFFCVCLTYSLRINLSVTIVAMTDADHNHYNQTIFTDWTEPQRGYILSSFFWGYVITQVPGGILAQKFGPKRFLLFALTSCSLLAIAIPICVKFGGWMALCALRVLQGLCQGVIFPSVHTLLGRWIPSSERGRAASFVYGGSPLGTVTTLAGVGILADGPLGWPGGFYVPAGIGLIWSLLWYKFGSDGPNSCKGISPAEKKYIESGLGTAKEQNTSARVPWLSIFASLPMWAIIIAHAGNNFGHWVLLTQIPTYMKSILHHDIKENGLLSSLPYLSLWLTSLIVAWIILKINRSGIVSLQMSRKLCNTIAHWGSAIVLIGLAYFGSTNSVAITLLCLVVSLEAFTYVGFLVNHLDLSPNYGGAMMGVTNAVGNLMGVIAPLVTSVIVHDKDSMAQWRIVFLITAGIYFCGNLFYIIFSKAVIQVWNEPETGNSPLQDIASTKV